MFLRNCWYMAGWDHEFSTGGVLARTLLGEALVFYRRTNGQLIAMADRCSHRFAPLSRGEVEGDDIRCMYHGLRFGPDGICNQIPQQTYVRRRDRVHHRLFEGRGRDDGACRRRGACRTSNA